MSLVLKNVSEELQNRLKRKGLQDDRMIALEKFMSTPSENLHHGLNIKTDMENINYAGVLNEGHQEFSHTHQELLDNRIKVMNFHEFSYSNTIKKEQKEKVFKHILRQWDKKLNKLDYLHSALSNVRIIIFEDHFHMEETFEIKRIIHGNDYNHLIILLGKNAEVNISIQTRYNEITTENKSNKIGSEFHNGNILTDFTDIILDDYAKSSIVEFRNLSSKDIVYGRKSLHLNTGAVSNWISVDKDSRLAIIEQHATLEGNNSKSTMSNVLCGRDSEYLVYNISEHIGKNTESLMRNKCGLKSSKAILRGLVKINEDAESSNGYQKSDILLIDENSRGISIPDLEIHNDKVKCTHGSTISRLDEEKIFYLQSRGLSKKESESLLIEGFYDIILNDIPDENFRLKIKEEVIEQ